MFKSPPSAAGGADVVERLGSRKHHERMESEAVEKMCEIVQRLISNWLTNNFANYNRNLESWKAMRESMWQIEGGRIWVCSEVHLSNLLVVTRLSEGVGEPLETLVETISRGSAGGLDVPGALSQAVEAELVCDLGSVHGIGKILLVGEDEEDGISEFILVQHALKLLTSLDDTVAIVAIDDEDDTLGVLEVVPPQRSDLVLTTDIPHGELNVLVLDGLDVEADGGDGGDNFTKLELVEDGGFTGGIESDHQNSHLLLAP